MKKKQEVFIVEARAWTEGIMETTVVHVASSLFKAENWIVKNKGEYNDWFTVTKDEVDCQGFTGRVLCYYSCRTGKPIREQPQPKVK